MYIYIFYVYFQVERRDKEKFRKQRERERDGGGGGSFKTVFYRDINLVKLVENRKILHIKILFNA